MQRMTGGRAVALALKAEGIDHVFGIVGTHDCPLFDGVFDDPAFKVVTVRHEQGASLMAAGYARRLTQRGVTVWTAAALEEPEEIVELEVEF